MVAKDQTKARTARVLAVPIFCGIFSFLHWFVFFPLMWTYLAKHGMKRFWLFALVVFLLWLLVMALCLCCWWYDKRRQTPVASALGYRHNVTTDGPGFETKQSAIQPRYKDTSLVERETISLRAVAVQPQDTPALYNLHTGRHSYDSFEVSKEVLVAKKEKNSLQFKDISSSESEKSSRAENVNRTVEATVESVHERDVLLRAKYDHCASAQEAARVHLSLDSEDDEDMFCHVDMDAGLTDRDVGERTRSIDQLEDRDASGRTRSIDQLEDEDRLSQNLPQFDDYLHIVDIVPPTPMSPREVFFGDLIRQANETEQKLLRTKEGGADRRSYCIGDITYNKLNYDHRKSVPLFLYSDQWRREDPEQSVDSDDNQETGGIDHAGQGVEMPGGQVVMPRGQNVMPEGQGIEHIRGETDSQVVVVPGGQVVIPRGQNVMPEGQGIEHIRGETDSQVVVVPGGQVLIPEGQVVMPGGQNVIPEGQVVMPEGQGINHVQQVVVIPGGQVVMPEGQGIEHIRAPTDNNARVVATSPKWKDSEDIKTLTQTFINEERLGSCSSPIVEVDKPTSKRDVEPFDETHIPRFPQEKPLKLSDIAPVVEPEMVRSRAKAGCREKERDKRKSSSEYFIAAVDNRGPTSVTSEVYLTVGASGLVEAAPVHLGAWGRQGVQRGPSGDRPEDKSDDDEVFEDVQVALTKLRRQK